MWWDGIRLSLLVGGMRRSGLGWVGRQRRGLEVMREAGGLGEEKSLEGEEVYRGKVD